MAMGVQSISLDTFGKRWHKKKQLWSFLFPYLEMQTLNVNVCK